MKASRRIDRSVCGAVLSARVPSFPHLLPQTVTTGPAGSRPQPSRCIHDQRRKPQNGRPRTANNWITATAAADPASGTLLPMLFPPAWSSNSSWKRPSAHKAMHFLESACHRVERITAPSSSRSSKLEHHSRANHSSAAAARSQPSADEFDDILNQVENGIHESSSTPVAAETQKRVEDIYDVFDETDYNERQSKHIPSSATGRIDPEEFDEFFGQNGHSHGERQNKPKAQAKNNNRTNRRSNRIYKKNDDRDSGNSNINTFYDSSFNCSDPITHPTSLDTEASRPRKKELTKDELRSIVDPPMDGDSVQEHLTFIQDPYLRRYAPPDDRPDVRITEKNDDHMFPTWTDAADFDKDTQKTLRDLDHAVMTRLRQPFNVSAEAVYDIYRKLPGTRMSYVPTTLRHHMLRSLNMDARKTAKAMLRFFAVIADVKDSGFPLLRAEYNAAMSFASRYVGWTTAAEAESAVNLWREMEQVAHIPGNEVTFNILFDVASKAGNFTLAELAYDEMTKRGLRFNRYHAVSLIHFFGLKMDGDGVRAAYREMVDAGEMIDVVVLNCVIASFLRCGEEDAAERVYARMHPRYRQRLQASADAEAKLVSAETAASAAAASSTSTWHHQYPPSRGSFVLSSASSPSSSHPKETDYNSQKVLTQVLMMLAKVNRKNKDTRAGFQYLMPIRPDLGTYRILINHYATRLGSLPAVTRLLDDMKILRIPLHGAIFQALFCGFARHGGAIGVDCDWSLERLRSIWAALLKALDDETEGLYISPWLLMWVLRAFDRCGSPEMVFKAYNSLTSRWDPDEIQSEFVLNILHSLLKKRKPMHTWTGGDGDKDHEKKERKGAFGSGRKASHITKDFVPAIKQERSILGQLGRQQFP
ncbi:hypothetical protein Sste5346_003326 [Sporothrix stenoceras]|uniref:Pentatricopeptide repeat protein n=1 Tax=Sporothrix stenoceras TaxID=5173 RepID=A0ABR3ZE04_9PEZI